MKEEEAMTVNVRFVIYTAMAPLSPDLVSATYLCVVVGRYGDDPGWALLTLGPKDVTDVEEVVAAFHGATPQEAQAAAVAWVDTQFQPAEGNA